MNVEILGFLLRYVTEIQRRFAWPCELLELVFWMIVLLVAVVVASIPRSAFRSLRLRFETIARFERTPFWIGVAAVAVRIALLPWLPIPDAFVHDEFSYLLGAKTLSLFRLTNPPHPLAIFFESFHINVWPTYQSIYLPGQAAFLCVGILLFNQAWWGMVLAVGLMCGTVTWMLRAYVPARWALLGGIFCILRYATFSYWMNGYWGGAVAALGGALLLGAWPRLQKTPRPLYGSLFAAGLVLIAFTRPFEGALFSLPIGIAAIVWLLRRASRGETVKFAFSGVAVLILASTFLLYYNYRGTGHPTEMPYTVNQRMYHVTGPFVWQKGIHLPNYHHDLIRRLFIMWEVPLRRALDDPTGRWQVVKQRYTSYYLGYFWPMILMAPCGLWFMLRHRRLRMAAMSFIAICVAVNCEAWLGMPHYMAPALGATLLIVITGLRFVSTMHIRGARYGRSIATAAVAVMAVWLVILCGNAIWDPYQIVSFPGIRQEWEQDRANSQLARTQGLHLVIVHDRATANIHSDWIHNGPDIDHSKVVWARDMGPYMDTYLLRYFANRQVWYIDNDDGVRALRPYSMRDMPDCIAMDRLQSQCLPPAAVAHPNR